MTKQDDWWRCIKALMAAESGTIFGTVWGLVERMMQPFDRETLAPTLERIGLAISADDDDPYAPVYLVVPALSEAVNRLLAGGPFDGDAYWMALRSAPGAIVPRDRIGGRHLIGNVRVMSLSIDLGAWVSWCVSHVPLMQDVDATRQQLRNFIERLERLEEEKREIAGAAKEVMAEAKSTGFDTAAIRRVLTLRRMDPDERRELEGTVAAYMDALEAD